MLWGLGAAALVQFLRFSLHEVPVSQDLAFLAGAAFLTEFFLLHSGAFMGSVLAGRQASPNLRWGCASALLLLYAGFVLVFALLSGAGWAAALGVLVQIVRHAMHWGERGGMSQERLLTGFSLLFGPFLTGMALLLPLSLFMRMPNLTGPANPPGVVYLAIFYFALDGWFASPWFERWRDRLIARRAEKAAARHAEVSREMRSPDAGVRRAVLERLIRERMPSPPDEVIRAIEDPDPTVRLAAVSFFTWNHPQALPLLLNRLQDPDEAVAERAAASLSSTLAEDAYAALQKYYLEGPNLRVALACGVSLYGARRRDAIPQGLARFRDLIDDPDPARRELAARALRLLETPSDQAL